MSNRAAPHLRIVDPNSEPPARLALKAGGIFVAANVLAGFLHYLYQAVASRELPLSEFSTLNAWYANFSIFLAVPTLLQYLANFLPLSTERIRPAILAVNVLLVATLALFVLTAGDLGVWSAVLILCVAALFSWMSGQAQSRLLMGALAIGALLVGLFKLLTLAIPLQPRLEIYAAAIAIGFAPGIWFLSVKLWHDQRPHPPVTMTWQKWTAPALLSLAAAVFPQMDLVLLNQTQSREIFSQFALASLFYKGLYFLVFAYLQWLLPQQVRAPGQKMRWQPLAAGAGVGLVLSGIAALTGPFFGQLILKWQTSPPPLMIFMSCVNTCLLTWIFVQFQSECAAGRVRLAFIATVLLAVEAGLQLFFRLEATGYLALAMICQLGILILLYRGAAPAKPLASLEAV
jgi:hypothetical protein